MSTSGEFLADLKSNIALHLSVSLFVVFAGLALLALFRHRKRLRKFLSRSLVPSTPKPVVLVDLKDFSKPSMPDGSKQEETVDLLSPDR